MKIKDLTMNAIIAAVYAVLTIFLYPISYGAIQMRLSEILIFLAFYNKKWIPGLVLGCFIANIPSELGAMDMIFGTFATLLAVTSMYFVKNKILGAVLGAFWNGLIVGIELHLAFGIPFFINACYVFIGELAVLLIGALVFQYLEKNETYMNLVEMS